MIVHDGFGGQEWFDAWYAAFAPDAGRFPLDLPSGDFAPDLYADRIRLLRGSWRFLRAPTNSHTPRYGWKLTGDGDVGALDRSLRQALAASGCRGVEIEFLPETGGSFALLRALAATSRWTLVVEPSEQNLCVDVSGTWAAYWQGRPAKLKKTLNAQERQLGEVGRLEYHDSAQSGRWEEWLERGLELEAAGWKGQAGSAILSRPNEAAFYRRVTRAAAEKGRLRLFGLTLDDRLIAFNLMMGEGVLLSWLKVTYDEAFARYGPAALLYRRALQVLFEEPLVHIVNMGAATDWTSRWATDVQPLVRVRFAPSGSAGAMALGIETALRRLRARFASPENRGA